jgi:hypothetical protein
VTIFTIWFNNLNPFDLKTFGNFTILIGAVFVASLFIWIFAKAAFAAEGRSKWVHRITGPNGKWFFGLLWLGWALVFGIGLQLVPHEGASSPYGGLGLIALFSGFFITMGFLWSVIGE